MYDDNAIDLRLQRYHSARTNIAGRGSELAHGVHQCSLLVRAGGPSGGARAVGALAKSRTIEHHVRHVVVRGSTVELARQFLTTASECAVVSTPTRHHNRNESQNEYNALL